MIKLLNIEMATVFTRSPRPISFKGLELCRVLSYVGDLLDNLILRGVRGCGLAPNRARLLYILQR